MRIITLLLCALFLLPLSAEDVRIGIFPFEPLNFIDENGEASGLYPDLIREIVRESKWNISFVEGSWAQGLERLENEEIDLMISVAYSEERDKTMDFNRESVVELWGQAFIRPEDKSLNINDLQDQPVAVMARDINGKNFIDTAANLGIKCKILEYASHGDVFRAVQGGEVLAGIAPQHFGLRNAAAYGIIPSSIIFSPFSIYFASKEGRFDTFLKHIDSRLVDWKKEETSVYYDLLAYWMTGEELRKRFIPLWLIISLAVVTGTTLLFLLFAMILRVQVKQQAEKLVRRERQYRSLVENAGSIILRLSSQGEILFINKQGGESFKYIKEELVGKNPIGIIFSEDHDIFSWVNKGKVSFVDRLNASSGTIRYIQWDNKVVTDEESRLEEILCIGVDITDRLQIEKDLKETNLQLEEMVYIASHDLQVPLVSMDGYAGELLENYGDKLDQEGQYCLNRLQSNSRRMHKLVLSLLDISRLNTVDNYFTRFSLGDIIKKIEKDISLLLEREEVNLSVGNLPSIFADRSRIEGVFRNLILNAVNYGGKNIAILHKEGKIIVEDDGIGIPESQLDRIFKPGERLKLNKVEGVGMGLTFSRKVVEQHNGMIVAESEGKDKGCSFIISFPENIMSEDGE